MRDRLILIVFICLCWGLLAFARYIFPEITSLYIVIFLCVIYTMFLSAAFTHQSRRRKKRPQRLKMDYEPSVSIMVPAHNEEKVIEKTVENLLCLDYPNFEIFIIDDRSTDNTPNIIKDLAEKYKGKINYLIRNKDAFPGKSAVLNDGLVLTKGEVICVFDADAKVKPDFLKVLLPYLAPEDIGAVQARKVIINKDENLWTRCQNNEYTLDNHFQLSRDSINGAVELRGNGELIKRAALEEVGGWNNYTITDDLDLSTKLHLNAWGVRYCQAAEVYEEAILKFIPLIRQRRRWVEGSIRRYLDYCWQILTSEVISLRASFDMLSYLLEFILPVLLVFHLIVQSSKLISGHENQLLSTLAVACGIGLFFFVTLLFSLKKYNRLSFFQTIKQSIETSFYMILMWSPVVIFIVFKIFILPRDMNWGKTSHGLSEEFSEKAKDEPILIAKE